MILRYGMALGLILLLSGCVSERHSAADTLWPFGNPNAPQTNSETAERALGKSPAVTPIAPQAGDVWPGAVQPMPTLSDIQKNANLPLGEGYTPSLPSPYPPGQDPDQNAPASVPVTEGPLYSVQPGAEPVIVPAVPGDAR
jgi:hypothetical protein